MIDGLAPYLASSEAVDPQEAAAWVVSDEGRGFMTLSSERWRAANVVAGAPEADAQEAAARTTAAYIGAG